MIIMACLSFFFKFYENEILNILKTHPKNHLESNGEQFWNGITRLFPHITPFDRSNQLHLEFLNCFSRILFKEYKIPIQEQKEVIDEILNHIEEISITEQYWEELLKNHLDVTKRGYTLEFDKDDEDHITFIELATKLREINYSIPLSDRQKCLSIAGRIVPALATTTSLTAGLCSMEAYKIFFNYEKEDCVNGQHFLAQLSLYPMYCSEARICPWKKEDSSINLAFGETDWFKIQRSFDDQTTCQEFSEFCLDVANERMHFIKENFHLLEQEDQEEIKEHLRTPHHFELDFLGVEIGGKYIDLSTGLLKETLIRHGIIFSFQWKL